MILRAIAIALCLVAVSASAQPAPQPPPNSEDQIATTIGQLLQSNIRLNAQAQALQAQAQQYQKDKVDGAAREAALKTELDAAKMTLTQLHAQTEALLKQLEEAKAEAKSESPK